jgi:hypothetical protein
MVSPAATVFAPVAVTAELELVTETAEILVTEVELIFRLAVQVPAVVAMFRELIVQA